MPLEEKAGDLSLLKMNAEQSVMPSSINPEAPVLELTMHKLTIGQEEAFRYMSYMGSITDGNRSNTLVLKLTVRQRPKAAGA